MSVASLPIPERTHRKSVEKMNKSGEIDVFEAARYFSGFNANSSCSQKILREERSSRGGRISLDMATRNILLPQQSCSMENQIKEKIKYKQPSSPGGRLASFLSSLFNQSSSKKKKKNLKSSSTMAAKEVEEIPGGTKKRRSSISHFRSYITMDSKSVYSSSSSGFRTPPPHVETPIKNLKEFITQKYKSAAPQSDELGGKRSERDEAEKYMSLKNGYLGKDRIWGGEDGSEKKEFRKIEIDDDDDDDDDDGEESDSSSDLFELQIYEFYSSDLPVYESTSLDRNRIRRGPPTSIPSPPL